MREIQQSKFNDPEYLGIKEYMNSLCVMKSLESTNKVSFLNNFFIDSNSSNIGFIERLKEPRYGYRDIRTKVLLVDKNDGSLTLSICFKDFNKKCRTSGYKGLFKEENFNYFCHTDRLPKYNSIYYDFILKNKENYLKDIKRIIKIFNKYIFS